MQMSERGQRMSVNQEIPSFAIELICTRLLYFAEFNASGCINVFFSVVMTKTF